MLLDKHKKIAASEILVKLASEVMGFENVRQHRPNGPLFHCKDGTQIWKPLTDLNDATPLLWAVRGDLWRGCAIVRGRSVKFHQFDVPSACRAIVTAVARAKSMISETDEIDWEK